MDECVAASAEWPEVVVFFRTEPVIGDVVKVVSSETPRFLATKTDDCAAGGQEPGLILCPPVAPAVPRR
ncbi:hypothetical protein ACIFOC_01264 [Leucobacter aridicollis]